MTAKLPAGPSHLVPPSPAKGRRASTFEDYRAIKATNWSLLRNLASSPADYHWAATHPVEETAPMRLGRAVHAAALEYERLPVDFTVYAGRRDDRIQAWSEFKLQNRGKTILTQEEWDSAVGMAQALHEDYDARRLLNSRDGRSEVPLRWSDPVTHIRCKARVDRLRPDRIVELKTTSTLSPHDWVLTFARRLYYGQAAFYAEGVLRSLARALPVTIVAVQSKEPHLVGCFDLDDDALYEGERLVRRLLDQLADCRRKRRWPGPYKGVQSLTLPPWAYADKEVMPPE